MIIILHGRCSFRDDQKVAVVTHLNSTTSFPSVAQAHQGQVLNDILLSTVHVRLKRTAAPQLCVPQTLSTIYEIEIEKESAGTDRHQTCVQFH